MSAYIWNVDSDYHYDPLQLDTEDLLARNLVSSDGEDRTIALLAAILDRMCRSDAEAVLSAARIHWET